MYNLYSINSNELSTHKLYGIVLVHSITIVEMRLMVPTLPQFQRVFTHFMSLRSKQLMVLGIFTFIKEAPL